MRLGKYLNDRKMYVTIFINCIVKYLISFNQNKKNEKMNFAKLSCYLLRICNNQIKCDETFKMKQ